MLKTMFSGECYAQSVWIFSILILKDINVYYEHSYLYYLQECKWHKCQSDGIIKHAVLPAILLMNVYHVLVIKQFSQIFR